MNQDKERLSEPIKDNEDMESVLLKRKKHYEGMNLEALVAEMDRKSAEKDRYMDATEPEYDSVDSEGPDVEKEYPDDKADWESGIDRKER